MVTIVEEEEVAKRQSITLAREEWKSKQASTAVEESLRRAARAKQVANLKNAVGSGIGHQDVSDARAALGLTLLERRVGSTSIEGTLSSPFSGAEGPATERGSPSDPARENAPQGGDGRPAEPAMDDLKSTEQLPARIDSIFRAGDGESEHEASSADMNNRGAEFEAEAGVGTRRSSRIWHWLLKRVLYMDRESYLAYVLFIVLFVADYSLLSLVFPVSTFFYALVSTRPSPHFWQVELGLGVFHK